MTPEDLAYDLIGTCASFPIPEEELQSHADVVQFDSLAFCCSVCGWWCSTEELHNETSQDLCDQCHVEDEEGD